MIAMIGAKGYTCEVSGAGWIERIIGMSDSRKGQVRSGRPCEARQGKAGGCCVVKMFIERIE